MGLARILPGVIRGTVRIPDKGDSPKFSTPVEKNVEKRAVFAKVRRAGRDLMRVSRGESRIRLCFSSFLRSILRYSGVARTAPEAKVRATDSAEPVGILVANGDVKYLARPVGTY